MQSQSFPKGARLLNSHDFNYLKNGASFVNTPFLRFYYKKSRGDQSRLGLSISKKAGNAVKRNYIKRRVREFFRLSSLRDLEIDILAVASPRLKNLKGDDFSQAVEASLAKAKLAKWL